MGIPKKIKIKLRNRGQKDAARGFGNYKPPDGFIQTVLSNNLAEQNKAYRVGYGNGVKQ